MQPAAGPSANHTATGSGDHAPVIAQSRGWAPAEAGARAITTKTIAAVHT